MDPVSALLVLVALVAVATVGGLVWRATNGRARRASPQIVTAEQLGLDSASVFGTTATLVQFSTEFCARCPATRRLLGSIAADRPGVHHVDVDLTHRPDLANRFDVRQTPTTLILDPEGRQLARIGGAPRVADVTTVLDDLSPRPQGTHEDKENAR